MTLTEQTRDQHSDRIAEELRLLIDAWTQRAEHYLRTWANTPSAAERRTHGCDQCLSDRGSPCDRCPLCALLAGLRGEQTEFIARCGEQLAAVLTAVREAMGEVAPTSPAEPEPAGSKVQRIAVQRVRGSGRGAQQPADGARTGDNGC